MSLFKFSMTIDLDMHVYTEKTYSRKSVIALVSVTEKSMTLIGNWPHVVDTRPW